MCRCSHTPGYTDAIAREPLLPDTVFRPASLSKALSSILTTRPVQVGDFDWNTTPSYASGLPSENALEHAGSHGRGYPRTTERPVGNTCDHLIEAGPPIEQVDRVCPKHQRDSCQHVA